MNELTPYMKTDLGMVIGFVFLGMGLYSLTKGNAKGRMSFTRLVFALAFLAGGGYILAKHFKIAF